MNMSRKQVPSYPFERGEEDERQENKETKDGESVHEHSVRNKGRHSSPAVHVPSIDQLGKIARQCNMDITVDELKVYQSQMKRTIRTLNEASLLPEPRLPVKYPRISGREPDPQENPHNAWSHVCTIHGAKRGKLIGKRIAVKDNIAVAGVPLMNGCHALDGYVPDFDATVVTRILEQGGTIIGKTRCEDLCYSGSSFTGAGGPVLNPHDTTRSSGGSSSGSAAAIAAGDVDMALGTDQGGSIRLPAAWCGVYGMKPTYGLVPYTGAMSLEPTVDHIGPLAKTVYDCALLLEVIAGHDNGLDHRQHPNIKVPQYTKEIENCQIDDERIGILIEGFATDCGDPRVKSLVFDIIMQLKQHGAHVDDISVPMHKLGHMAFACFAPEGINAALLQNGGGGYGHKGYYPSSMISQVSKAFQARPNDVTHRIKLTRLLGEYLKNNYGGRFYAKGRNLVLALRHAYDTAFQVVDILAMPTVPYTARKLPTDDCSIEDHFKMSSACAINTKSFNSTGHPAISIPVGKINGLPVGLTLVGRHFDEVRLLRVAKYIEQHCNKRRNMITPRL
ncbi:amidase-like [Lytechinus pictus]|uniref:amidase-like n=1 Tax=Lytechinus pictus TaxID=7653 RepID=UPI0030BA2664